MLRVVPDRKQWLRDHPLDVAIVLLTPPLMPPGMQSARVFRLLRLIRLMRMVQLTRRVFSLNGLRDAAVLTLAIVLVGFTAPALDGLQVVDCDGSTFTPVVVPRWRAEDENDNGAATKSSSDNVFCYICNIGDALQMVSRLEPNLYATTRSVRKAPEWVGDLDASKP